MALYIKNPETEALARKVAELKGTGLTEAIHAALQNERDREIGRPDIVKAGVELVRKLHRIGDAKNGKPADKAFIDSLYEDD